MRSHVTLALIAACTLVSPVAGEIELTIDPALSSAGFVLCILDNCDTDSSPLAGRLVVDLDDLSAPTQMFLNDYQFSLTQNLQFVVSVFLGSIDVGADNIDLSYPFPGVPLGPSVVSGGAFQFLNAPAVATGLVDYNASGLACFALDTAGLPCSDLIDLATLGQQSADGMAGSIHVNGNTITILIDIALTIPIVSSDPDLAQLDFVGTVVATGTVPQTGRLYVDQSAGGFDDGSSWGDAYVDLRFALAHAAVAPVVSEIWVAAGVYTPAPVGGDRAASFALLNGVAIYGGFAGGETDLAQRDIVLNPTILSGDLNFDDAPPALAGALGSEVRELISATPAGRSLVDFQALNRIVTGWEPNDASARSTRGTKSRGLRSPNRSNRNLRSSVAIPVSIDGAELHVRRLDHLELGAPGTRLETQGIIAIDNSLHVVTVTNTDATAILDGFTITAGNADGVAFPDNAGGGVFNMGGSATFRSCRIQNNHAAFIGAGMFNANAGHVTLIGCGISGNTSNSLGGGVYNFNGSSPTFSNCAFVGNRAETLGGGMANVTGCFPILIDTRFQSNIAVAGGGGLFNFDNSNATLDGCNFSGNLATQGGAVFTIDASPVFTSCTFNNNNANLGGGMFEENSSSILIGCDLSGNRAFAGGAFFSTLSGTSFQDCTLIQNTADVGGAMYNHQTSAFSMCSCDLSDNVGKVGGAMYNTDNASLDIVNTTINGNTATGDVGVAGLGGAIINIDNSNTALTNCTLCSNTAPYGGAMLNIGSSPQLSSCTLSGNIAAELGDAMFNGGLSFATVTNSIVWNANVAEIFEDATSVTTIDFSDVFGGWPGTGNIAQDPLFFTTTCADRSLSTVSHCIDAGDNGLLPPDTCDLDGNGNFAEPIPLDLPGNPRINGVIDMGAFESP